MSEYAQQCWGFGATDGKIVISLVYFHVSYVSRVGNLEFGDSRFHFCTMCIFVYIRVKASLYCTLSCVFCEIFRLPGDLRVSKKG